MRLKPFAHHWHYDILTPITDSGAAYWIIMLTVAMETMHFFHSANKFFFEDKNSLHFWGPNERFGTC